MTDDQWRDVFRLRCRAKRGETLDRAGHELLRRALREDPERYSALDADVFDATVPFGSGARARRTPP